MESGLPAGRRHNLAAPGEAIVTPPNDTAGTAAAPPTAESKTRHFAVLHGGLLLVCFLAYLPIWVRLPSGAWPFGQDALQAFKPWYDFSLQELHRGAIPLWNPHLFCGTSFIGNIQTRLFYPPGLIYLLLPLRLAFLCDAFLHSLLVAGGAYLLARALRMGRPAAFVTAAILATGGAVAGHLYAGHITWHAARAYMPWELWALLLWLRTGRRGYLAVWAACFALQILAGSPPQVIISCGFNAGLLFAYGVMRRRGDRAWLQRHAPWLGAACIVIGTLVAIVVLPFVESASYAVHSASIPYEHAIGNSVNWRGLARLLVPGFFGGNTDLQWSSEYGHEEAAYIGLVALILAFRAPIMASRQGPDGIWRLPAAVPWLWALLPIAGMLSLGDNLPFYHFLHDHCVLIRLNRVPARWLDIWFVAAALLTGFSLDGCLQRLQTPEGARHSAVKIVGLTCAVLALAGIALALFLLNSQPQDSMWQGIVRDLSLSPTHLAQAAIDLRRMALVSTLIATVVAALAALCFFITRSAVPRWRNQALAGLVLLLVLDPLFAYQQAALIVSPAIETQHYDWPASIVQQYKSGQRWSAPVPFRNLNAAMSHGIDIVNGYDPLMDYRFYEFATVAEGASLPLASYQPFKPNKLIYAAGPDHTVQAPAYNWQVSPSDEGAWPRAYLTRRPLRVPPEFQLGVLAELAPRPAPAERIPVVVGPDALREVGGDTLEAGEAIAGRQVRLNQVEITTSTKRRTALVQADTLLPGWHAWVNGAPTPIVTANYLFRAVQVPAGKTTVVEVYEPQSFRFGAFITLCALGWVTVLGVTHWMRQRAAAS